MKILLAVDGSSASERAIDLVGTTAWPAGSHVRLIHVAEPNLAGYAGLPGVMVSSEAVDEAIQADREYRQELLATTRARLEAPGRGLDSVIVDGRAASSIVDAANAFEADLIVLGSHGRGAIGSAVLGSVAAEVVEYAATPVLVVRNATVSRLVLADDGSSSAAAARALLGHMPGFRGLPVRVVSAAERQPGWLGWLQPEAAGDIQAFEEALQADFKDHETTASKAADELAAAGLVAEGVAPVGDPATEIVHAAEAFHADLIVMGTRGKTGFERLLLGSVAHKVVQRAHCSVLVVRRR
ncbi:MAG TPA: universal stress protein [Candidatus Limnocylindrales bacterium]|jgi:nucleotide-binding universal stress UspA family protein